jgi:hypothetical protein
MIPPARIIFAMIEDDFSAGERKRARPHLANWEKDKNHHRVGLQNSIYQQETPI